MNIFRSTFKGLFFSHMPFLKGLLPLASKKSHSHDTEMLLQNLKLLCSELPDSVMMVQMRNNEFNIHLTWKGDSAPSTSSDDGISFSINGNDDVVTLYDVHPSLIEKGDDRTKEKRNDKQQMVLNLSEYLKKKYSFRYNVITEQTEFSKCNCNEFHTVSARNLNGICLSALADGVDCWDKDIKRFIESDNVANFNPFHSYLDSLPEWDGTDRISPLAERVSPSSSWVTPFHRWMLSMTACWMGMDDTFANSVAPILVSSQQGMGKSTFCRLLMPKELDRYFSESFDLSSPTEAEKRLVSFGLINLDEFDKLPKKKMPLLKNIMQMKSMNIRRAYKHSYQPAHRMASFIGTSNCHDLLTDATGSRRFVCVEVTKEIDCSPIDCSQIYAQLKHELLAGKRYWFSKKEENAIERVNRDFYSHKVEEDVFYNCFRFANENDLKNKCIAAKIRVLNTAEVFAIMKSHFPAAMHGISSERVANMLPKMGTRVHTKYGNGFRLILKGSC